MPDQNADVSRVGDGAAAQSTNSNIRAAAREGVAFRNQALTSVGDDRFIGDNFGSLRLVDEGAEETRTANTAGTESNTSAVIGSAVSGSDQAGTSTENSLGASITNSSAASVEALDQSEGRSSSTGMQAALIAADNTNQGQATTTSSQNLNWDNPDGAQSAANTIKSDGEWGNYASAVEALADANPGNEATAKQQGNNTLAANGISTDEYFYSSTSRTVDNPNGTLTLNHVDPATGNVEPLASAAVAPDASSSGQSSLNSDMGGNDFGVTPSTSGDEWGTSGAQGAASKINDGYGIFGDYTADVAAQAGAYPGNEATAAKAGNETFADNGITDYAWSSTSRTIDNPNGTLTLNHVNSTTGQLEPIASAPVAPDTTATTPPTADNNNTPTDTTTPAQTASNVDGGTPATDAGNTTTDTAAAATITASNNTTTDTTDATTDGAYDVATAEIAYNTGTMDPSDMEAVDVGMGFFNAGFG